MTHRIIITPNAERDLRQAYRYIRDRAPRAATQWIGGMRKKIRTLSRLPERCPLAPESRYFPVPIRELLYGSGSRGTYRILFIILAGEIYVLHVRHGSMDALRP